jgi:hypothetical protein
MGIRTDQSLDQLVLNISKRTFLHLHCFKASLSCRQIMISKFRL